MTLLRTKIKREAKEIVKYTKRKVKKIAKKIATRPGTKPKKKLGVKKKNPQKKTLSKRSHSSLPIALKFEDIFEGSNKDTRDLVYDLYESYEAGNEQRGIDSVSPRRLIKMIEDGIDSYDFEDGILLSRFANKLEKLPRNTEIYLPHTY